MTASASGTAGAAVRRLSSGEDREALAAVLGEALSRRAERLIGDGDRGAMVDELGWLQEVDRAVQVHLNRLGAAIYGGKHPKHWLWKEHKRWILERVHPGERVLDVGCGCSAYLQWMAERGCEVTAVDVREDVLGVARRIMSHERLRFVCADIMEGVPAPAGGGGGAYDAAVCAHVIEHLDDPVAMLRALRDRVPRLLVAVPPVHSRWQKVMFRDLGLPWMDDEDHEREYTAELLREQLGDAGWTVRELHDGIDIKALAV